MKPPIQHRDKLPDVPNTQAPQHYHAPTRKDRACKYWWFDGWDRLVNSLLRMAGRPHVVSSPGTLAIDFHVHTLYSHCSVSRPDRVLKVAAALGMDGVGIMDHNTVDGALDAMRCAEDMKRRGILREDFLVIPCTEINSEAGHIGALFVTEKMPENLSPAETVNAIHKAGGLAIAVHPYHSTGIGDAVFDAPFDAVEVECGSVFPDRLVQQNRALATYPRLLNMAKIGTSDAHYLNAIGSCYTVLEVGSPTLDGVRQALLVGRTKAESSEPLRRIRKLLGMVRKLR